jgi:hypothetical protein
MSSQDAVKDYHDRLGKLHLKPHRPLKDDLDVTEPVLKN